ncbi:MAG TPA: hypothetical protein VKE26_23185 [Xanthobacteraceae bacterium]|nr:hypothetical protein [Xanthobacteraceae bacterium]
MGLLAAFIVLAIVGQVANVTICLALERFYPSSVTIPIFFVLWVGTFWLAWRLALRITEPRARPAMSPDTQRMLALLTTAAEAPMIV